MLELGIIILRSFRYGLIHEFITIITKNSQCNNMNDKFLIIEKLLFKLEDKYETHSLKSLM